MRCCFCGTELENDPNMWDAPTDFWYCPNEKCVAPEQDINVKVWQALISGKKAQDALNKIIAIKESVEGCCAEIQQNCLPFLFSINRDIKWEIDKEVSAIDKYMSEIDEIASITKGDEE